MAVIFDTILTQGVRSGQIPARTDEARNWYRDTAFTYKRINETQLMKGDVERLTNRPLVGHMYMFYYDAKHKETLPYFDKFPMIFPFKKVKGGFLGINLHYLPLKHRAILMDGLYDLTTNDRYDQTTKLRLSYNFLESASKYRFFKPTVKHYLTDHVKSRFLYVYPSEWDIALFLPLERFQGATKQQVWRDSRKAVGA